MSDKAFEEWHNGPRFIECVNWCELTDKYKLKTAYQAGVAQGIEEKWTAAENLPEDDTICLVKHYNEHREILRYINKGWWFMSEKFSEEDVRVEDAFEPDFWMVLP